MYFNNMTDYHHSIHLLEELDSISRIHFLKREDIDEIMIEFASRIVATLDIERLSVWLFEREMDSLVSIGEYDSRDKKFKKNSKLEKEDYPTYFKAIHEDRIIIASNVYEDPRTVEFTESYSIPNKIITLMDIPLRIGGNLVGVMCFEKTGDKEREFTPREKSFAFSVALVFASNLEARYRRAAQHSLELALKEKELLIKEMNHRIRNNFAILISLLKIRKALVVSEESQRVIDEFEQRIYSMMTIHDLLRDSDSHIDVNIGAYLGQLVEEFQKAHVAVSGKIDCVISEENCWINSRIAVNMGLIVTEIFLNSLKHVFPESDDYFLKLTCEREGDNLKVEISDSGEGFDFKSSMNGDSLGLSLIMDLADDLGIDASFPEVSSSTYTFLIPNV